MTKIYTLPLNIFKLTGVTVFPEVNDSMSEKTKIRFLSS